MSVRILFVCLGNICRSPMAEAVMRHKVQQAGLSNVVEIDSAGTGDWHIGKPPHEGTRKELDRWSISYSGMRARQVTAGDFQAFDYVICMDQANLRDVRGLLADAGIQAQSGTEERLFTFMELLPDRGIKDVPDPYYSGNFEYVYELIESGCIELLRRIQADIDRGQR